MPLCFLAPSGSGVLTHPRQADQAICFPGLRVEKRCSFLTGVVTKLQREAESIPAVLPPRGAGEDRGVCGRGWGSSPSHPCLLAGGLHRRHLQRFLGFLLTHGPSAKGAFSAGSASFQRDHSVLTDNSAPPFKNKLLYAYFCVASDLPGKASALLAYPPSRVQSDLLRWLFLYL